MKNEINTIIMSAGGVVIRKTKSNFYTVLLYKNKSWVLPKGRIEQDESEETAALREIYEETQIPIKRMSVVKHLGKINYISSQQKPIPKTVSFFLIKTNYEKLTPIKNEGFKKAKWFEINEAFHKSTFPESKGIILKAIKELEPKTSADIAVVAVGGRGNRMGKLNTPKLLLDIHGQPFLKYVIDNLLQHFKHIYILTGYNKRLINKFINGNYKNKSKITVVYGGIFGNAVATHKIKKLLKSNFVYFDGNVICKMEGLRKISSANKSIVNLLVSPTSLINTHLHIATKGNKVEKMIPVISIAEKEKLLCNLGIIAFDHRIFQLMPNFDRFSDLGILVYTIFKSRPEININFMEYKQEWFCIHTIEDLDYVKKNGKFFNNLKGGQ